MKTFKQILSETSSTSPSRSSVIVSPNFKKQLGDFDRGKKPEMSAEKAAASMAGLHALNAWSKGDITSGDIGWQYSSEINPKPSMTREKAWGTDVGLAFDTDQDGQLVGNQAGFEAVRRRRAEGKGFNFKTHTMDEYRKELLDKLNPFK